MMKTMKNKASYPIGQGDLVKVKVFAPLGTHERRGIVISKKFDDENMMFPCIDVYIFGLNDKHRCMSHQLEILSSAS